MTGTTRFVCTDPDAGDLEFADVEAVLDALEAALGTSGHAIVRRRPPELAAAWTCTRKFARLGSIGFATDRRRSGLGLPELPSVTALVRSLPDDGDERERRRDAYARVRAARLPPSPPVRPAAPGDHSRRLATIGLVCALLVLAVVGWALVTFATRLTDFAAGAVGLRSR